MNSPAIPLFDPDISEAELEAVKAALLSPKLSGGPVAEEFEEAFAAHLGRRHAVSMSSGGMALLLTLKAYGIGPGCEVIVSPYSWRETAHSVALAGAKPVFCDVDYWAGTLSHAKAAERVTERTRALVAANTNGHPAAWTELTDLARANGLTLVEDSTEAIGSMYKGGMAGSFGDCSIFDFSDAGAVCCGEGGMIVTDDGEIAATLRRLRGRPPEQRASVVVGAEAPYRAAMSELTAALGLAQLRRIDEILARRKQVERWYFQYVKSFEGIKDPYIAADTTRVDWFLYVVHLGARFARSTRDAIIEDLRVEGIGAMPYCRPLHTQRLYLEMGYRRSDFLVAEKLADRAVALPFHAHLTEERVAFIAGTMKDASTNVGAGTPIYL
jgi:hypothetical protein